MIVNKVRTVIYLDKEQSAKLKALSEKTGAPVAELGRRAIAEYLKRGGRK